MAKPKAVIFSGYGLNCEEETQHAFELAGAIADIVHVNDVIENPRRLRIYQIMAFPGGFSYGDDLGSGKAYAHKLRNHLWNELVTFVMRDTLTVGICNGFQIITHLGLVPAVDNKYGNVEVALTTNDNTRYTVRWVDLKTHGSSPWLKDIRYISLPIAHGEGKFIADDKTISSLQSNNQIALSYVEGDICKHFSLSPNPNGSTQNIAGITDMTGRILGLMPHPERAIFFTQLPHWTYLKEKFYRSKDPLPKVGNGLQLFNNAVNYFK